jgi:ABC-type branched-subunit amino acid transport system substrate-binding protein
MTIRKRLLSCLALAGAATLGIAGCSSSGSSSSTPSSSATGASSATAASGATAAAAASKSPITVEIIAVLSNPAFSDPEAATAAQAYVKQANASGGINGHPIVLQVCDSNLNPNKETACFQQAVTDHDAAVVGSFLLFGTGMKLLQAAGIPFIGGNGTTTAEFTSPISFPADSGEIGWYDGEAALMKKAGVTKPAIMYCDTAACDLSVQFAQQYWTKNGGGTVKSVLAPLAQAAYSSQAASTASGGTNGVMMASATQAIPKMVTDLRQANFTGPIALIDSFVDSSTVSAMGSYANGLLVSGLLDPVTQTSSVGVKAFVSAMNAENPSAAKDGLSEHTWNGFDLFSQAAKTISGPITGASLLQALENIKKPITLGLSGPWVSPGAPAAPLSQYPRLTSDDLSYVPEKIDNNQLVATGPRAYLFPSSAGS